MNPLTQLRPDQAPVQMERVCSFHKVDDMSYIDCPHRIYFMFDNSSVIWEYQSKTSRDLDYTYLWENYVKMS